MQNAHDSDVLKSDTSARASGGRKALSVQPPCRALHKSDLLIVEELTYCAGAPPVVRSGHRQILLPLKGYLMCRTSDGASLADANRSLFSNGDSTETSSGEDGCLALAITAGPYLTSKIDGRLGSSKNNAQRTVCHLRTSSAQLAAARLWAASALFPDETLMLDELAIAATECQVVEGRQPRSSTIGKIDHAIRIIHDLLGAKLALGDIAKELGLTPRYLTTVSRQITGLSLQQYRHSLRLSRALIELPYSENLSELSFSLGYSSHSHFSASFVRAYDLHPSQFRDEWKTPAERGLLLRAHTRHKATREASDAARTT